MGKWMMSPDSTVDQEEETTAACLGGCMATAKATRAHISSGVQSTGKRRGRGEHTGSRGVVSRKAMVLPDLAEVMRGLQGRL